MTTIEALAWAWRKWDAACDECPPLMMVSIVAILSVAALIAAVIIISLPVVWMLQDIVAHWCGLATDAITKGE